VTDKSAPAAAGDQDLVELIRQQCADEIGALQTTAAERAERIRAAAAAEAEALRTGARALGEARGRQASAKRVAVAETESRRAWLWAREQLIDEVLDAARQRLARFPDVDDGPRILHALIDEALRALPAGAVVVRVSAAGAALLDRAACDGLGRGRWELAVNTDGAPTAGVVVESADGRVRFDNSFEARMRRGREHLRRLVLDTLLAGEMPEW